MHYLLGRDLQRIYFRVPLSVMFNKLVLMLKTHNVSLGGLTFHNLGNPRYATKLVAGMAVSIFY